MLSFNNARIFGRCVVMGAFAHIYARIPPGAARRTAIQRRRELVVVRHVARAAAWHFFCQPRERFRLSTGPVKAPRVENFAWLPVQASGGYKRQQT